MFNLFLEKIMQETLHDHRISISISGSPVSNLRFADDVNLIGGSNDEPQDLINRLVDTSTAYGKEVKAKKEQDHDQQHEQHQCRY